MTETWLFQANPNMFDIDGFLNTKPTMFLWLVRQNAQHMHPGDRVFIWRSVGDDDSARSGVVAEAEIAAPAVAQVEDEAAVAFWRSGRPDVASLRIRLRMIRIAATREVIRRDWVKEDAILGSMRILKMANATNYRLPPEQATRLDAIWTKTGRPFSYGESVAALWAYDQTYGGTVSSVVGSTVSGVALVIGRAVSGVYNKVMNFRHLDPRDQRAGLSGGGAVDARVWARFFDPAAGTLDRDALSAEYHRLWQTGTERPADLGDAVDEALERVVRTLTPEPLGVLFARYNETRRPSRPKVIPMPSQRFERDVLVIAIARRRASFQCEVPACSHPIFLMPDGQPYTEVHHIEPLAEGGEDTPWNVACLCPAHHREVHHGKDATFVRDALRQVRAAEGESPAPPAMADEAGDQRVGAAASR